MKIDKQKLDNESIQLAFEDIKQICDNAQFDEEFSIYEEYLEMFDTVELALDELIERREMMKRFNEASVPSVIDDDIYKKAKALEIIKEKRVSVDLFFYCANRAMYNNRVNTERQLTQEEYDLLKEVLA